MFEGFHHEVTDVGVTTIAVRCDGGRTPVLLLHGFPETHVMWHRVAPGLAEDFAVVCADLRGYGASGTPASTPDHASYTKAAMAGDIVALMDRLGFERFAVVGHDRGGRVAYRLALDHRERVLQLAVLDVIPTGEALDRADARLALGYWPWSLLAQPEPLPERLIAAAPDAFVNAAIDGWGSRPEAFPDDVRELYVDALRDPARAHAICEEYRAAGTLDYEADRRDRAAGRQIEAPTLVLWAASGPLDSWYQDAGGPLAIWRAWTPKVAGQPLRGGHFFPEENPEGTSPRCEPSCSHSRGHAPRRQQPDRPRRGAGATTGELDQGDGAAGWLSRDGAARDASRCGGLRVGARSRRAGGDRG